VPNEVFLYNTPLTQETQMRNFAAFVQDRATYNRVTLNLGLRWSYFDGNIPEQTGGGGKWFPVTTYPEINPGFNWNTIAPRTGVVVKLTEDGKNVAKASYSRYFESMYTTEYAAINPNSIQTGGIETWSFLGDLNGNGKAERNELGVRRSQFQARSNSIDPNLKAPKNDEIMFAYQRELASNWSLNVDWIQRWFTDMTTDQNCYGLPCNQVASTVYALSRTALDRGPDQLIGTGDDRTLTFYDVKPEYVGRDTFLHTNCGNNVSVECEQRYKAFELSIGKRMSNRWQMQGSYVWSRLDGVQPGISTTTTTLRPAGVFDLTNPNNLIDFVGFGRGGNDQPHAFKILGSYQAPWGINVGANYQALSGLPRDRTVNVALAQGTRAIPVESRGTYRADRLSLLSLRADKGVNFKGHRASVVVELHNALNSSAGQNSFGNLTQSFANQAAFDAARRTTSYFGRIQEIVAPRVLKFGFKLSY
jgi:hypothetical protein